MIVCFVLDLDIWIMIGLGHYLFHVCVSFLWINMIYSC